MKNNLVTNSRQPSNMAVCNKSNFAFNKEVAKSKAGTRSTNTQNSGRAIADNNRFGDNGSNRANRQRSGGTLQRSMSENTNSASPNALKLSRAELQSIRKMISQIFKLLKQLAPMIQNSTNVVSGKYNFQSGGGNFVKNDRAKNPRSGVTPESCPEHGKPIVKPWPGQSPKALAPKTNLSPAQQNAEGSEIPRLTKAYYGDGKSSLGGTERPNPRAISNSVSAQETTGTKNDNNASSLLWNWGQFVDHDVVLTKESENHADISVPKGDPTFDPMGTGKGKISFKRSDQAIGKDGVAFQTNEQTSFLDGSQVYGPDRELENSLRSFEGGRMKVSEGNNLPRGEDGKVMAGDKRAAEQPGLESLHTIFVREHNRLADRISQANPGMSDRQVFTEAKRLNVMQMQKITYTEFLPTLLGDNAPKSGSFAKGTDGRISSEFSTAAFRIGHTMVNDSIDVKQADGSTKSVSLSDVFFTKDFTNTSGAGNILGGLSNQKAEKVDPEIVDSLRNQLFGPPGPNTRAMDLASLNIQRGRDHGLPSYNEMREAIGLRKITSFDDAIFQSGYGEKLASVYDSPDEIDLWVGGLAENTTGNGMVGETFSLIIADQFARTMSADPDFYLNNASESDRAWLEGRNLGQIINDNAPNANVDDTPFIAEDYAY